MSATWIVFTSDHADSSGVYASEDEIALVMKYPGGQCKPFADFDSAVAHFGSLKSKKRSVVEISDDTEVMPQDDDTELMPPQDDDTEIMPPQDDEAPVVVPHKAARTEEAPDFEKFAHSDTSTQKKPVVQQVLPYVPPKPALTAQQMLETGMDAHQREVLRRVQAGDSLFFTGSAGTGKSHLIHRLVHALRDAHGNSAIAVTASTGAAAVNVRGITIHSWAGVGIATGTKESLAIKADSNGKIRNRMKKCRALVIDEISMVSDDLLDKIEYVCRYVKSRSKSDDAVAESPWFGGIQVIMSGDFLQLPPVSTDDDAPKRYAFMSQAWRRGVRKCHVLRSHHRQSDPTFVRMLDNARHGVYDEEARRMLQSCVGRAVEEPVHLYARRDEAAARNESELAAIQEATKTYKAADNYGDLPSYRIETIKKNWPADEIIRLKKGARVLLLRNLDLQEGLCNGSQGTVIGFKPDPKSDNTSTYFPEVKFRNGKVRVIVQQQWVVEEGGFPIAMRMQVPLTLAYALTIHKSQGMTLDAALCDVDRSFASGQSYVAISRTRTLDTLCLRNVPLKIQADPVAVAFHRSIGD